MNIHPQLEPLEDRSLAAVISLEGTIGSQGILLVEAINNSSHTLTLQSLIFIPAIDRHGQQNEFVAGTRPNPARIVGTQVGPGDGYDVYIPWRKGDPNHGLAVFRFNRGDVGLCSWQLTDEPELVPSLSTFF